MKWLAPAIAILVSLSPARAQEGGEGVLIYHEPLTTYAEAMEYHAFRQDNALFCTVTTTKGAQKRLKSGSVIAVVPYPGPTSTPLFEDTAHTALRTIKGLAAAHPQVQAQLQVAEQKWERALAAFHEISTATASTPARASTSTRTITLPGAARLTSATTESATIMHTSGVSTIPLRELSATQILALNATSRTVQLPLGVERVTPAEPAAAPSSGLTHKVELAGRSVIGFVARKFGITDTTFSVWTFFVVLPGLMLVLLVAIFFVLRSRPAVLPPRRYPS